MIKTLVLLEQNNQYWKINSFNSLVAATTSNTTVTMRISLKTNKTTKKWNKTKKNHRILHFRFWKANCKEICGCECVCCTEQYAFIPWELWRTKIKAQKIKAQNSPTYLHSLDGSFWYSTFPPLSIRWSNYSIRNYNSSVIFMVGFLQ